MWHALKRIGRAGFIGFVRNTFVSLAAIFVMVVTLFVLGASLFMGALLDVTLGQIQEKVDVNVYFVTTVPEEEILSFQTSLQNLPEVKEVTYISREEALERFRERHQNNEVTIQALEELGENPLGASLAVRANETSQYESIAAFIEAERTSRGSTEAFIDRVNFFQNKEAIDKLTSIIQAVEQFSLVAMIVLLVSSVLITFNTIRLAIYTSREEISVMRLVGAGNMFIRGPFVFQGVLYGLIAALITLLIFYPLTLGLASFTESFFLFNIFEYYVSNFAMIFLIIIGAGMALGALSSVLAITRYLRV